MVNLVHWERFSPGTLVDEDIHALSTDGLLIQSEFEPTCVRQACYELRSSDIFYETGSAKEDKRVVVSDKGYLLKPHCFVTAIVMERINLPNNVIARVLTKGQLFSLGIAPVNTYADPGFVGRLGITLYNFSHRYIVIQPGQPIAKIEFSVLPKPVKEPYAGQHGYETEIWPIPSQHYATSEQVRDHGVTDDSVAAIKESYGPHVASLAARVGYYERKIWLQIAITVLSFLALFSLSGEIGWVIAVAIGVAANIITNLGMYLLAIRKNRRLVH